MWILLQYIYLVARSDLGRLLHAKISYQNGICCLFTGKCNFGVVWHGAFQHFYCCSYWTEKWICSKIAQRKFDAKECKTREWICAKVVNATFACLFQHGGVNRYENVAFITFAQIYSLVCTFLYQICAEQFCCNLFIRPLIEKSVENENELNPCC